MTARPEAQIAGYCTGCKLTLSVCLYNCCRLVCRLPAAEPCNILCDNRNSCASRLLRRSLQRWTSKWLLEVGLYMLSCQPLRQKCHKQNGRMNCKVCHKIQAHICLRHRTQPRQLSAAVLGVVCDVTWKLKSSSRKERLLRGTWGVLMGMLPAAPPLGATRLALSGSLV